MPGGWRDEPKDEQKIAARSRVLCNNYLEGLFHTVPSSFVLHCSINVRDGEDSGDNYQYMYDDVDDWE